MTGLNRYVEVNLAQQRLKLYGQDNILMDVSVSTASNGAGELFGSECTPRGKHVIRAKIGAGCVPGTVFVARRPTGEVYSPDMRQTDPARDWILSRILWLSGCERGKNRLGNVDTMRRFIYIHGVPDDEPIGMPNSHGCVRMRNTDVIQLFDQVEAGTPVNIIEE
ncbi:MAG: L,D-transpeptidase [Gammaproteobacteria bacterium]|nr:L,D-transpeptidase [Gammaproteobacteria bacterium]MDH5613593.1 L,D-transpeptidase [Gammaproteobacteria bacterium]